MATIRNSQSGVHTDRIVLPAAGTLDENDIGCLVLLSSGEVALAAISAANVLGVLTDLDTSTSPSRATVQFLSPHKTVRVKAGGAITAGGVVESGGNGELADGSTAPIGIALEAGVAGQFVEVAPR